MCRKSIIGNGIKIKNRGIMAKAKLELTLIGKENWNTKQKGSSKQDRKPVRNLTSGIRQKARNTISKTKRKRTNLTTNAKRNWMSLGGSKE